MYITTILVTFSEGKAEECFNGCVLIKLALEFKCYFIGKSIEFEHIGLLDYSCKNGKGIIEELY